MSDEKQQSGWGGWFSRSSDGITITGGVWAVIVFLLWTIGWLPSLFLVILGTIGFTLIGIGVVGQVFVSSSHPIVSLGDLTSNIPKALQEKTPTAKQDLIENLNAEHKRIVDELNDRIKKLEEEKPTQGDVISNNTKVESEPDLVCLSARLTRIFPQGLADLSQIITENRSYKGDALNAAAADFGNEINEKGGVSQINALKAQITFYKADGTFHHRVNNGWWLIEKHTHINLTRGHSATLILVEKSPTANSVSYKSLENHNDNPERYNSVSNVRLVGSKFNVQVSLIAESNDLIKTFMFSLTLEPTFAIELVDSNRKTDLNEEQTKIVKGLNERIKELEEAKAAIEDEIEKRIEILNTQHQSEKDGHEKQIEGLNQEVRKLQSDADTLQMCISSRDAELKQYTWLHKMASTQARDIDKYVIVERVLLCDINLTDPIQIPYVEFWLDIINTSVYDITIHKDEVKDRIITVFD